MLVMSSAVVEGGGQQKIEMKVNQKVKINCEMPIVLRFGIGKGCVLHGFSFGRIAVLDT